MTPIKLVDGPSTSALVDAYKYAYDKDRRFTVEFKDESGTIYKVVVTSLQHEDGSGNSHIFTGNLVSKRFGRVISNVGRHTVSGWFHAGSRRHGFLELDAPNKDAVRVDREGKIWAGNRLVGELPKRVFA